MFNVKPIPQGEALHTIIVRQIEKSILADELKPGDRLPGENELARAFGVSRTVIREALMILRQAQLITVRHGIGTFVAEVVPEHASEQIVLHLRRQTKSIWNVHEVRYVLEPELAALAARRATDEDIQKLTEIFDEIVSSVKDVDKIIELDLAFHTTIAAATQNSTFQLILQPIMDVLLENRKIGVSVRGAINEMLDDHKKILSALQKKDPEGARQAMLYHLQNVADSMKEAEVQAVDSNDEEYEADA